jgi:hypothetical protein
MFRRFSAPLSESCQDGSVGSDLLTTWGARLRPGRAKGTHDEQGSAGCVEVDTAAFQELNATVGATIIGRRTCPPRAQQRDSGMSGSGPGSFGHDRRMTAQPLLRSVDAVTVPVPDLDAGLSFYRDRLGHSCCGATAR